MRRTWSKSDLELLKEKYTDTPMLELIDLFNCSKRAIYSMCKKIGAKRSEEFVAKNARFQPGSEIGKEYRFKTGSTIGNKHRFKKGSTTGKEHRFKPGNKPANTMDGNFHISTRNDKRGVPQKFIKLADGVWVHLSRHNWEQNFGNIPEGHVIAFEDKDTLNCEPSNLICLSKADNMKRNSWHNNYPPEMKEVVMLRSRITRKVKKLTKN